MEGLISYVFGALAGITAVWAIISKLVYAQKYLELAKDTIELVDEVIEATKDKTLSAEEIKKIAASYEEVKEAFKKVRGK